jgi:cytochrome oxidase assembly protein ShyY1
MGTMVRQLLTPRWLAIDLIAVVLVLTFGWLGHWQLDRAAAFHQSAGAAEPAPVRIDSLTSPQGALPGEAAGRLVVVAGRYDPEHSYLVPSRVVNGRSGFWLLSVLKVPTGAGVLVVRGWTPTAAAAATYPPPAGPVVVTGRLTESEDPGGGLPPGTALPAGQVAAASPVTLLSLVPYPLYDGYVVLRAQVPPSQAGIVLVPSPRTANDVPGFYFQHVAYVALWWLFAAFVLFFWWRLAVDELKPTPAQLPAAGPSA